MIGFRLEPHAGRRDDQPHGLLLELQLVGLDDGVDLRPVVFARGQYDLDDLGCLVHDSATPLITPLPGRVDDGESLGEARRNLARHKTDEVGLADAGAVLNIAAEQQLRQDRKSTRLNSSHSQISYAVFCLKKISKTKGG